MIAYFEDIAKILPKNNQEMIAELKEKKQKIDKAQFSQKDFTRSERDILKFLTEATLLGDFGVSNSEIMTYTGISKRTAISSIQKFRQMDLPEECLFSRTVYQRQRSI